MDELASLDVAFTPQENDFLSFDEGELPKIRAKIPKAGCVISNSSVAHETVATGDGKLPFLQLCVVCVCRAQIWPLLLPICYLYGGENVPPNSSHLPLPLLGPLRQFSVKCRFVTPILYFKVCASV